MKVVGTLTLSRHFDVFEGHSGQRDAGRDEDHDEDAHVW